MEGSGFCVCIRSSARNTEILDNNAAFIHKSLENCIEVDGDVGSLRYISNTDYLAACEYGTKRCVLWKRIERCRERLGLPDSSQTLFMAVVCDAKRFSVGGKHNLEALDSEKYFALRVGDDIVRLEGTNR